MYIGPFWAPLSLTPEQKHSVGSAAEVKRLADELSIKRCCKRSAGQLTVLACGMASAFQIAPALG